MTPLPTPEPKYDSLFRLITERLYWFAIGPLLLILLLLGIIHDEADRRIFYSLAFLVALAGLPLSRWLEFRGGQALTADSQPATWVQFRNYAITVVVIGIAVLLVVNAAVMFLSAT